MLKILHPVGIVTRITQICVRSFDLNTAEQLTNNLVTPSATVEGMMRRAQLLEQTPDTQANLDDDLWFLARDIWDWYQRQDIDVQESSGEVALEAATRLCRRSLELRPPGHPKRAHSLHNLAKYLLELHVEHDVGVADLSMLAESVALSREALSLRSLENRHYEACLETLFEALVASYTNGNGEQKVFEDALTYGKQLMEFHPPGVDSGLRGHFLSIFGDLWWARAKFTELSQDRDMGISYYKEAVECSDDVESQCQLMIRLGFCLQMSSNYGQEHVSFTNMDRANRKRKAHAIPSILDVKLATTAKAQLNISKLDEAICWFQKASKLAGLSDTDQSVALEHLGSALDTSAIINNSLERLHQAAASYRLALELLPKEHENRSELLDSLADTSAHLYGMTNDETFLLEAIGYSQRALDLCSQEPTPKRANHLVNLALLQKEHAVEQCDGDNMRLAIKYFHDALEIHMTGSDDHAVVKRHGDLAECFLTRDLPTFDLAQGAQYLLLAIKQKILPARDTLIISTSSVHLLAWAVIGTSDEPFYRDHLVQALREMMTLLAHMVSFGQDLDTRLATLNGFDWVGESFSMIAMALGMNDLALEIIEQARGLFWTQALYLREAKLDLVPDDITTELGALLSSLDEKTLEDASADDKVEDASQSTRYLRRKQADRVDELIHDIRLLPGLQRFMLAPEHSQLLKAARDSFIVVLLPCSCEAMLIRQGGQSVERLELSDMTEEILEIWTRNIRNTTFRGRGTVDYSTEEKVSEHHERGMMRKLQSKSLNEQVQAQLWQRVVKPVITAFGLQVWVCILCLT
jgi:tetratricopeptide (TPR) repeat protein